MASRTHFPCFFSPGEAPNSSNPGRDLLQGMGPGVPDCPDIRQGGLYVLELQKKAQLSQTEAVLASPILWIKKHPKRHGGGPWAIFINFWILPKLGTGKARDFKFDTQIDMSHLTDNKIPPSGVWWGFGAKFVNFGSPFINFERA